MEHEKSHNPMPELENLDILIFDDASFGVYSNGIIMYMGDEEFPGFDFINPRTDRIKKIFRVFHHSGRKIAGIAIARNCKNMHVGYVKNIVWERKGK